MIQKLLLLLLFIGRFYSCLSQASWDYYSVTLNNSKTILIRNKIKQECLFSYKFNKKGIKDSTCLRCLTFDSLGNTTLRVEHLAERDDTTRSEFQYNADHSIHRVFWFPRWAKSRPIITEYAYDSAGNVEMIYSYSIDTSYIETEKRAYNEKKQWLCSYRNRSGSDVFYLKNRWYYSEDSTSEKEEFFDSKGAVSYSYIEEFDKGANEKRFYREDKKEKKLISELFFDSSHQCIRQNIKLVEKYTEGIFSIGSATIVHPGTEEYKYNQDGTIFESVVRFDDSKKSTVERHYYQKN